LPLDADEGRRQDLADLGQILAAVMRSGDKEFGAGWGSRMETVRDQLMIGGRYPRTRITQAQSNPYRTSAKS